MERDCTKCVYYRKVGKMGLCVSEITDGLGDLYEVEDAAFDSESCRDFKEENNA